MTAAEIPVDSGQQRVGRLDVFRHTAAPPAGTAPTLYLHGVPTNADDWLPFLAETGGVAPDLPGFGRSAKPIDFDYSIAGYGAFLSNYLEAAGIAERFSLVVHDWGVVGLAIAPELLARAERVVIMSAVPFLPGYRWHRIARLWRMPVVGELAMGFTTRGVFRRLSGDAWTGDGPMPDELIDRVFAGFDQGTQRAILRLYRSAPSDVLAAQAGRLANITCPTLVVWGEQDPFLPHRFADEFAEAVAGESRVEIVNAGHWPWVERPEIIDTVSRFLLER